MRMRLNIDATVTFDEMIEQNISREGFTIPMPEGVG